MSGKKEDRRLSTHVETFGQDSEAFFSLCSGDVSASFTLVRSRDRFEAAASKNLIVFQRDVQEGSLIRATCHQRLVEGELKIFIEFKAFGALGSFVTFVVPDGAVIFEDRLSSILFALVEMECALQMTGCRMTVSVFQKHLSDNEFTYFYTLRHRPVPNRRATVFHSVVTRSSVGLRRISSGPVSFYKADVFRGADDVESFASGFNDFPPVLSSGSDDSTTPDSDEASDNNTTSDNDKTSDSDKTSDNTALKMLLGAQSYARVMEAVEASYI